MGCTFAEKYAIVGTVDPDANTAGAIDTDEIALAKFHEIVFIVLAGDLGASATLDFKVQSANAAGGSYGDVTGAAVTQLTKAGTDDNKQVILVVDPLKVRQLDSDATHIKGTLTTATATSDSAVLAIGRPRFGMADQAGLSSVDEIVNFVN